MNEEEFKATYIGEDGDYLGGCECVYISDSFVEYKTVTQYNVYKVGEEYFKTVHSESNSGHWGDAERYPVTVYKVKPVEVTITEYHEIYENSTN
jgi:hypothetical protein